MEKLKITFAVCALVIGLECKESENMLTAFDQNTSDLGWRVVNDNVMGGRSLGSFRVQGEVLLFTGSTNTNGGGFSSIRSAQGSVNIKDAEGVQLKIMGDGRTYTFRLGTKQGVAFWADFKTSDSSQWETLSIPFFSFVPRWR